MSPFPPPPPPPPPPLAYVYVINYEQQAATAVGRQVSAQDKSLWNVAPPRPLPQLRICIADSAEADRILQLQGFERDEKIQSLVDECLSRLGVAHADQTGISIRTETSSESGLLLILTFLNLGLVTAYKFGDAAKSISESVSAWSRFILELPTARPILHRAVRLGYPIEFNETFLAGLALNHARTIGYDANHTLDFCLMQPILSLLMKGKAPQSARDVFGVLTCNKLHRPDALHGFIVTRAGQLLARGMSNRRIPTPHRRKENLEHQPPSYKELITVTANLPEPDIKFYRNIAAILPGTQEGLQKSNLWVGIFPRADGMICLWGRERATAEVKEWPSLDMEVMPPRSLL